MKLLFWRKAPVKSKFATLQVSFTGDSYTTYEKPCGGEIGERPSGWGFYRNFYKWYFCRPQSDMYMFSYSDGESLMIRRDITRISFNVIEKEMTDE